MNRDSIFEAIKHEVKVRGYECCLRGSMAAGTADLYSDIDAEITADMWNDEDLHRLLRAVSEAIGGPVDIRFDSDEKANCLFSFHSYLLPIYWRIDLKVTGGLDGVNREQLAAEYPWYTHWHEVMKQAYRMKTKMRETK